jgi:catechol 2,3-dioxygenase-like lactoylglutathione lyase family enzyme
MLNDKKLKAFVPTTQPDRAKTFYRDTLGLKLIAEDNYALEFDVNGTLLRIAIVREFTPHPFTALGWDVDDIALEIKYLNSKGIAFEKYGFFEQDELGIWKSPSGAKVAWFKDPDGNTLSLTQY